MKKTTFVGANFGRLTIIGEEGKDNKRRVKVRCECGTEKWVSPKNLLSGNTQSCGCLCRERNTAHGLTDSRLYHCWRNMRRRCNNESYPDYHYYRGRGISVCPEWHDAAMFMKWALASGYQDHLTLDRKDTNGNYEPDNCRWATHTQQKHNTRRRRSNTSGYVGVWWSKAVKKYHVQPWHQGRRIHLGYFDDPFSAAWVRDEFVKRHRDQHATTNNLTDRRRRQKRITTERRGTFNWDAILEKT